jgi:K+-sensing histidine kinase KdpD
MAVSSRPDRVALIAAVTAPLGVAAALVPFRDSVPNAGAALVLVVVVVAIAANGHRLAGIVAAASAAVWFDFVLTKPYERFTITHRADIETTVLLLLVGAAVT